MAYDAFLKIDGIPGESRDSKHAGEIDLQSWSFGCTQAGTMAFGGGGGAGKVQMHDIHITMPVNKASPKLFLACATGEHIKSAVLTCRKAGKEQQEYLKYTFTDMLVSSYQTTSDANHGGELPVDRISLNFSRISVDYKVQNEKGQLVPGAMASYDVKANKAC